MCKPAFRQNAISKETVSYNLPYYFQGTKHPSSFSASARIIGKVNKWQIEFPTRRNHYYIFEYAKINHGATLYDDTAQEDITLKDQYLRILKSTLDDGMDVEDVSSNLQKIVSKASKYSNDWCEFIPY